MWLISKSAIGNAREINFAPARAWKKKQKMQKEDDFELKADERHSGQSQSTRLGMLYSGDIDLGAR